MTMKKFLAGMISVTVAVYVGYKTYQFLKPEPINEVNDLEDYEVDPTFELDD